VNKAAAFLNVSEASVRKYLLEGRTCNGYIITLNQLVKELYSIFLNRKKKYNVLQPDTITLCNLIHLPIFGKVRLKRQTNKKM
jgi:hypothetical protein